MALYASTRRGHASTPRRRGRSPRACLNAPRACLNASRACFNAPRACLNATRACINAPRACFNTPRVQGEKGGTEQVLPPSGVELGGGGRCCPERFGSDFVFVLSLANRGPDRAPGISLRQKVNRFAHPSMGGWVGGLGVFTAATLQSTAGYNTAQVGRAPGEHGELGPRQRGWGRAGR